VFVASQVLANYYTQDFARAAQTAPWDFSANLLKFYTGTLPVETTTTSSARRAAAAAENGTTPHNHNSGDVVAAYYNFFIVDIMGAWLGVTPAKVRAFLTDGAGRDPDKELTLGGMIRELAVCDFESVVMCTKHRRNIVMSLVVAYVTYWVIAAALSVVGIQGASIAAWGFVWLFALWLAYGYSPACLPMVPTCMIEVRRRPLCKSHVFFTY
jgi:hypothetical protein